ISLDTTQKTVLFSGYVQYNEQTKVMWSYINPVMKKMNGKDSMFLRAETFYSAPLPDSIQILSAQDSLELTAEILQSAVANEDTDLADSLRSTEDSAALGVDLLPDSLHQALIVDSAGQWVPSKEYPLLSDSQHIVASKLNPDSTGDLVSIKSEMDQWVYADTLLKIKDTATKVTDTSSHKITIDDPDAYPEYEGNIQPHADTSGPRYFLAYHHVLMWSDSLQGKCDSLSYSEKDSLLTLFLNPVLWPKAGQMHGAVIIMKADT